MLVSFLIAATTMAAGISAGPAGDAFYTPPRTLAIPRGTAPARGWPLIIWAHGTVGNAPERGYAVAQTDYPGNGAGR